MRTVRSFATLVAGLTLLAFAFAFAQESEGAGQQAQQERATLIQGANVFDGEGSLGGVDVLIEAGRITEVGDAIAVPDGAEVIDGSGRTLLPGLIDSHVHTFTPEMLVQGLVFGVTTVLDMFTDEGFAAQMRQEQEEGTANYRADLYSAGWLATAPGGHGTQFGVDLETLTSPDQADEWVQGRVDAGADYIKLVIESWGGTGEPPIPTLDAETVAAVIEAAHERDLLTVTHVQTLEAAQVAVDAGTDGLAHMFSDAVPPDALVQQMVDQGTFVIPTLSVFQSIGPEDPVDETLANDPNIAPFLTSADLQSLANPFQVDGTLGFQMASDGVAKFREAGVPILAGSDAPNPGTAYGASIHRELELLTRSGLTAEQALAAATSVPARTFGLSDRGRIAPGMAADLLLVNGDPTQDVLATRDIAGIWKRGVRMDREAYREALAAAEESAAAQADALAQMETAPVSDFEAGDLSVGFGNEWVATTDQQAGGDSTATIDVIEGGAGESAYSLLVTGEVGSAFSQPWSGVMFMPGAQPFAPADLSSKSNLTFSAMGDPGTYRVQLFCQNLGQAPGETTFDVTDQWQEYEIALNEVGGCDPTGVMAVIFSSGEAGEFSLQIDDVVFR